MADASAFPYGLRVLVVDDDPTWLKILEKMLRKCSYEGSNLRLLSSSGSRSAWRGGYAVASSPVGVCASVRRLCMSGACLNYPVELVETTRYN